MVETVLSTKPEGDDLISAVKLANKIARVIPSKFSGMYQRDRHSCMNPALMADSYSSVDVFRHDYLLFNLLRKYNEDDRATAKLRANAAVAKFLEVDNRLKDLNQTLTWSFLALNKPVAHKILFRAMRKIERLLGSVDLQEIFAKSTFSHGASAKTSRREGRASYKFASANPEVTPACLRLALFAIQAVPHWYANFRSFTICTGNRLTTVPKDKEIDRVIACEPQMNMYVQKGIGSVMRSRLLRVGINLNDQSVNQRLAREGSISNTLATIDLSSASDSVSIAICKLLLPGDWFDLLLMSRSDVGVIDDMSITYNKMSSMGNGYTFELESLLFWAITQSCEDFCSSCSGEPAHRPSVYGDDIVCRSSTADCLRYILDVCGFQLNIEKSFIDGPFRESCGKHYFNGVDVSPFFIRGPIRSISDLIGTCNRLRRWNRSTLSVDDPRYVSCYEYSVARLPKHWRRPRIPDGYGDGALYGTLDEVRPKFIKGCYTAKVLTRRETTLSPEDKGYSYHEHMQHGDGAFIGDFHHHERPSVATVMTNVKQSVGSGVKPVTQPGSYRTALTRVRLYEWSDHITYDPA